MRTSEQIGKICAALLKAQKEITFAVKDAVNPHLKSKYADLPSVIDAIKTALNESDIVFMQTAGEMVNMHLQLTTRLMHSSGEWIEDTMTMPLTKQDPQGYGSALTYARRYSLAAITGLYQDDDDGNKAVNKKEKKTISGTDGYFEKMTPPVQHKLIGIQEEIESLFQDGKVTEGYSTYLTVTDNDEKIALWSLLQSSTRTLIKKTGEQQKKVA